MAHTRLDDLSVSELEDMLRRELDSDAPADADMIKAVTAALDEKTNHNSADIDKKWRDFRENYAQTEPIFDIPEKRRAVRFRPRRWIKTAIAAAMLAVMAIATVTAADMGGPTVLWSVDSYRFDYANIVGKITAPWFDDVPASDVMADRLLPDIPPMGYRLESLVVDDTTVTAVYTGSGTVVVKAEVIDGHGDSYSRDNTIPEEYDLGRVTRYISTDSGCWFAAWTEDGWGVTVTGAESFDQLTELLEYFDRMEELR